MNDHNGVHHKKFKKSELILKVVFGIWYLVLGGRRCKVDYCTVYCSYTIGLVSACDLELESNEYCSRLFLYIL